MSENLKVKIFYVEATDPYRETSVVGSQGFFDESQADALEKERAEKFPINYSYMVQEIYVSYSHRNGETDDPEVDGWYFLEWCGQWTIEQNPCQNPYNEPLIKYYGPIPMPEPV